jgi:hypothetical protein
VFERLVCLRPCVLITSTAKKGKKEKKGKKKETNKKKEKRNEKKG